MSSLSRFPQKATAVSAGDLQLEAEPADELVPREELPTRAAGGKKRERAALGDGSLPHRGITRARNLALPSFAPIAAAMREIRIAAELAALAAPRT